MSGFTHPDSPSPSPWRRMAASVVEELFAVTPVAAWDGLLDLRTGLVKGTDWLEVFESFSRCRKALEEDHYLPFYRLRRLLAAHLQFEHGADLPVESLEAVLRKRNFNFRRLRPSADSAEGGLRLVEKA